jgi:hypothetical protein
MATAVRGSVADAYVTEDQSRIHRRPTTDLTTSAWDGTYFPDHVPGGWVSRRQGWALYDMLCPAQLGEDVVVPAQCGEDVVADRIQWLNRAGGCSRATARMRRSGR